MLQNDPPVANIPFDTAENELAFWRFWIWILDELVMNKVSCTIGHLSNRDREGPLTLGSSRTR